MSQIDTAGRYRGPITEHSIGVTKNGYPQFIARLFAAEKWVDELKELKHFHEQGVIEQNEDGSFTPQWVDWSSFDEYITAYMVLFNNADEFSEDTKLYNYDQLVDSIGWDGTEFDSLNNDSFLQTVVQFRVEEDEYNGQTRLRVNWMDPEDANPQQALGKLDDDKLKALAGKLKIGGKKAAKPAKASKPGKSGEGSTKPKSKDSTPANSSETSDEQSDKPDSNPPAKKSGPPKKGKPAEEPAEEPTEDEQPEEAGDTSLPKETKRDTAWELICENKGDTTDSDIEDAWIAACTEVGEDKDEDDFTEAEWAKVRDIVIRDLALDV